MTTEHSILIISGLDPSGGAGFIADTRIAAEHGMRPVGVVTALTEQDTSGVRAANPVPVDVLADQLQTLLWDVEVAAVKIGALGNEELARAVASALEAVAAPAVWDPVLRPTAGRVPLYSGDPVRTAELLAGHVAVITPNIPEAASLWGREILDLAAMRQAAEALRARTGAAILIKGGHLDSGEAVDVLATDHEVVELRGPRVTLEQAVHGTGCALSTSLACGLAAGLSPAEAARAAKEFVAARLARPRRPGRGAPAVV